MTTHRSKGMIGTGLCPKPLSAVTCGGRLHLHVCKYEGKGTEVDADKIELMRIQKGMKIIPHLSYVAGDLADDSVKASVDGISGAIALNSAAAAAVGVTGTEGANNGLTYTADVAGVDGNELFVELVDPGANDQALAVSVKGQKVTVSLATGAAGAITSTAAEVLAAVNAAADCDVTASHTGESTGVGVVAAASVNLAGGTAAGNIPVADSALVLDMDPESASRTVYATVTGAIPVGKTVYFGIVYTQV